MASPTIQKLLRNQSQSAAKVVAHLRQPHPSLPPFALTRIPQIIDVLPSPNHPRTDSLKPDCYPLCGHVYPSFSFGFFLNPVAPTGLLIRPEPDDETATDDSSVIRADSVKKKRKKKMNKHKLRKLRKRLRKKT